MKIKYIPLLFLALLGTNSFADYAGDYCEFNGVSDDPNHAKEEEFAMLLSSEYKPNFATMANVVGAIAVTPTADLKNLNCKVSEYAKQLVEYYRKHEDEIKIKNREIAEILDFVQKKLESIDPVDETENSLQEEL